MSNLRLHLRMIPADKVFMSEDKNLESIEQFFVSNETTKANEEAALFDLGMEKSDFGSPDSLRFKTLTIVLEERYDDAIEGLKKFLAEESEYPNFKLKVGRLANHCVDLIHAIKAKRNFPGLSSLTRAKQQELREKFRDHFKELKSTLKKIEKVTTDLRIQDARTTIYVVKASWYSIATIFFVALTLELIRGTGWTAFSILDDYLLRFARWLTSLLGF